MQRTLIIALALAPAVLAPPAAAECYTVFQGKLIVYRSELSPIDLSGPIHIQLSRRFPGGQLVISNDVKNCTYIDPKSPVDPMSGAASSVDTAPQRVQQKPPAAPAKEG